MLLIEQASFDVTLLTRQDEVWVQERLTDLDASMAIPSVGLACSLADLYARTSLVRARKVAAQ